MMDDVPGLARNASQEQEDSGKGGHDAGAVEAGNGFGERERMLGGAEVGVYGEPLKAGGGAGGVGEGEEIEGEDQEEEAESDSDYGAQGSG
ncbi:MAG: hypothetical protein C5B50_07720 [Verrucomicrobia bacterium]|nr:MAG: hypothetical protein C5B50_07720 [Verrucomicrobiota bacterium]